MSHVLAPGAHRVASLLSDRAIVEAMLQVEVAWTRALAEVGLASDEDVDRVQSAAATLRPDDVEHLVCEAEQAGNAVVPLVAWLRSRVGGRGDAVHRGLTSQDVVDTALMLVGRAVVVQVRDDLVSLGDRLAALARRHRDAIQCGRTLTQWAVPITFGLKVSQWLQGVSDALERLESLSFPAQYGGAGGTRALVSALDPHVDQERLIHSLAEGLGLDAVAAPWHTRRGPVTAIGDALVTVTDALSTIASDVLQLARPEVGEVAEGNATGRGGSSTMPHKENPVLSVLIKSAGLRAPLHAGQLHLCAAQAVDERPDGAWHAEWLALEQLLSCAGTASGQAVELAAHLRVEPQVMRQRAEDAASQLLAESRGSAATVEDYLGQSRQLVDAITTAWEERRA